MLLFFSTRLPEGALMCKINPFEAPSQHLILSQQLDDHLRIFKISLDPNNTHRRDLFCVGNMTHG